MSEIKKKQVYRLVGPMEQVAYAIVLDRRGDTARVMLLSDDVHTVSVVRNEYFGSEYCKVPGKYCDFVMSSACAMDRRDDREIYEYITRLSCARKELTTDIARRPVKSSAGSDGTSARVVLAKTHSHGILTRAARAFLSIFRRRSNRVS